MLLGRERERRELDRLLATARSGRSAVLALVGEPGIGKTALLRHAAEQAGSMRVLQARGIDSETQVPFAALFELLRPVLGLVEQIPLPQAAALEGALALRPSSGGDRFAVGAATLSLLAASADESPTLVLVDDAHLLDASSTGALLFALRRLLAEPIAAVLCAREGEPSLLDDADLPTLQLAGLDRASAAELLGPVPREVVERLYRVTAGNPLALLELHTEDLRLSVLTAESPLPVPAKIARAFTRRSEALDEPVRRLLVLAAASDSGEVPLLERAAGSLGLELTGIGAAEQAGLVEVREGRIEFRHPLARAAIYADGTAAERRDAHRALAAALPDRDVDRRAWHLAGAAVGGDDAASSALEQAAARAHARRAYAVSAAAFERAARLATDDERRGRLLFAAADAAWLAGLADRAVALLAEAQPLAGGDLLVQVEHLRGRIATRRGPVMEGHSILVAAAERAARDDPDLAVTMLAEAVDAGFFAGAASEMVVAARRARELVTDSSSLRARFLAATAEGMALVFEGDGQRGMEAFRAGVAVAESSDELREDTHLQPWLMMGPLWLRESEAGRTLVEAAIETARAQTALGVLPWLLNRIARIHAATESWARAGVEYDEAIRIARETGQRVELGAALAGLAWLEAREGREAECRAHAAEARELCEEVGVGLYDTWALRALGELELGLGRHEAAVGHFELLEERLSALGVADVDVSPAAELVETYLRLGRRDDAVEAAARLEREARAKGQPWALARAARCRGLLADDDAFEPHFDEALRLHGDTPDVFEAACTHLAYGARLRRARRRVRAREQLRAAFETFDTLGARPRAKLASGELAATGETARRRDPSTLNELTNQELQIAHLLAAGKTTREAAAALFLSPKTIEYHLRNVYRKLGVNSRGELSKALAGL